MKSPFEVTDAAVLQHLFHTQGIDIEAARREVSSIVSKAAGFVGVTGVLKDGRRYHLDEDHRCTYVTLKTRSRPRRSGREIDA